MTWEYVLKAPWVQNIDFKAHDAPRIGRYIKYLENLLDENNRNSFKRWWSMGSIKTGPRPEGSYFDSSDIYGKFSIRRYPPLSEKHGQTPTSYEDVVNEYRITWPKFLKRQTPEKKATYPKEWTPEQDPRWQQFEYRTSDLPASGVLHMKAYYDRNKDIDSNMDIVYEKEFEDDPDSALEKADNEFKELIDDLEQLTTDLRKRYIAYRTDSYKTAQKFTLEEILGEMVRDGIVPPSGVKNSRGDYYTVSESHHGVTINLYPHWLPRTTRFEGGKVGNVTHLRVRANPSQGPGDFALCYMDGKKQIAETCTYKAAYGDTSYADAFSMIISATMELDERGFMTATALPNWGNTRESQRTQTGNIKEWHYLPVDSSWYQKGITLIKRTLENLKKIGREWHSELRAVVYTHGGQMPKEGERLTGEWEREDILAQRKPRVRPWFQHLSSEEIKRRLMEEAKRL
tara:strand:- start:3328 stop:4701 length:1374 start_codon:yes stop_codon:yes gene_type:complete